MFVNTDSYSITYVKKNKVPEAPDIFCIFQALHLCALDSGDMVCIILSQYMYLQT